MDRAKGRSWEEIGEGTTDLSFVIQLLFTREPGPELRDYTRETLYLCINGDLTRCAFQPNNFGQISFAARFRESTHLTIYLADSSNQQKSNCVVFWAVFPGTIARIGYRRNRYDASLVLDSY